MMKISIFYVVKLFFITKISADTDGGLAVLLQQSTAVHMIMKIKDFTMLSVITILNYFVC
jgi:hypothetical protein